MDHESFRPTAPLILKDGDYSVHLHQQVAEGRTVCIVAHAGLYMPSRVTTRDRMRKKAVQQGRSKRRGESYSCGTVSR